MEMPISWMWGGWRLTPLTASILRLLGIQHAMIPHTDHLSTPGRWLHRQLAHQRLQHRHWRAVAGTSLQSLPSGALTMTTGSACVYESANNSATDADLLVVNGALSLTSVTLDLSAANLGLNTWLVSDKLTLDKTTGMFT